MSNDVSVIPVSECMEHLKMLAKHEKIEGMVLCVNTKSGRVHVICLDMNVEDAIEVVGKSSENLTEVIKSRGALH